MTVDEFKEITRAVVLALREELTIDNKDMLEKISKVGNTLKYDGNPLTVDISSDPGNNLFQKTDGLYATNTNVTTESTPVGEIIAFMGTTAPSHYLFCDGSTYSISDYPLLAQFFTIQFGTVNHFGGDGTTTFAVPDLRGEFLRGTGTNSHVGQGNGGDAGSHQDATYLPGSIGGGNGSNTSYIMSCGSYTTSNNWDTPVTETRNGSITTSNAGASGRTSGGTVRPTNTSVMYCIKYEPTVVVNETRFLVTRPDLWELGTEIDLGDGLYGIRKKGTITAEAGANNYIDIATPTTEEDFLLPVSYGGYFRIGDDVGGNAIVAIGQSISSSSYSSVLYHQIATGRIVLCTKSSMIRTNARFEVWVTYRKS